MVSAIKKNNQAAILSRAIRPDAGDWTKDMADAVLSMKLSTEDRDRMNQLAKLASAGNLSQDEEVEIEEYRQATRMMELFKAKARLSLSRAKNRT